MDKEINPIYPNSQFKTFCYIKSVLTRPNIIVGDYSYYDDMDEGSEYFEKLTPLLTGDLDQSKKRVKSIA